MSYPHELKYDTNHHWSRLNRDGTVTVGVTTAFLVNITGPGSDGAIARVQLPAAGARLGKGQDAGAIEGSQGLSGLYSPIAGTVTAANTDLNSELPLLRNDPYGDGWLFTLQPADPADLSGLMDAAAYSAYA